MGKYIVEALLKTGKHTVTALTRPDSTTVVPAGVKTAHVNYDDESSIVAALQGQDILLITLSVTAPKDTQSKIIRAAAKAGLRYLIPNGWGQDPTHGKIGEDTGLVAGFKAGTAEIESLGLQWINISCSFWYEWSLGIGEPAYGFDIPSRSVTFFDSGDVKINTTTWPQVGRAVAAALSLPVLPQDDKDKAPALSRFFNGTIYVSSFLVSQKDMFESVKRVTATTDADWTIRNEDSGERFRAGREAMMKGHRVGFAQQLYSRVFFPSDPGNYESIRGLDNDLLGLPKEDIDEASRASIQMVENKQLPYFEKM